MLELLVTHRNTLQHPATPCNTLQHTAHNTGVLGLLVDWQEEESEEEEDEDEVDDGIHVYIIYVCVYLHVPLTPVCI